MDFSTEAAGAGAAPVDGAGAAVGAAVEGAAKPPRAAKKAAKKKPAKAPAKKAGKKAAKKAAPKAVAKVPGRGRGRPEKFTNDQITDIKNAVRELGLLAAVESINAGKTKIGGQKLTISAPTCSKYAKLERKGTGKPVELHRGRPAVTEAAPAKKSKKVA